MNIRESLEALEESYVSPYAFFSSRTRERDKPEPPRDMRSEYQRNGDHILHSKTLRCLRHKIQVFLTPEGDHYRTRPTHTLEASQIAYTVAKTLRPNESPTRTIALGHDLGHTPSGHSGEHILNEMCKDGFTYYQRSVCIAKILEKDGRRLSFTWEVRGGILNYRTSDHPSTLEGAIVHLSDKVAYVNRGTDDTIRARILVEDELSEEYTDILGHSVREYLNNMIHDIILDSMDKLAIIMPEGVKEATQGLRKWMFENVYENEIPKAEEGKVQNMIRQLHECYMGHVDRLPMEYALLTVNGGEKKSRVARDYIAGMSNIHAIDQFEELFVPKRWNVY